MSLDYSKIKCKSSARTVHMSALSIKKTIESGTCRLRRKRRKKFRMHFFPSLPTSFFCYGSSFGKGRLRATRSAYHPPPPFTPRQKRKGESFLFPSFGSDLPCTCLPRTARELGPGDPERRGGDSSGLIFTLSPPCLHSRPWPVSSARGREGGREKLGGAMPPTDGRLLSR